MKKDYEIIKPAKTSDFLRQKIRDYQKILDYIFYGKGILEVKYFKKEDKYHFILTISTTSKTNIVSVFFFGKDIENSNFDYLDTIFNKSIEAIKRDIIKAYCS